MTSEVREHDIGKKTRRRDDCKLTFWSQVHPWTTGGSWDLNKAFSCGKYPALCYEWNILIYMWLIPWGVIQVTSLFSLQKLIHRRRTNTVWMRTSDDIYAYVGFIYCELSVALVIFSLIHLITHAHCRLRWRIVVFGKKSQWMSCPLWSGGRRMLMMTMTCLK